MKSVSTLIKQHLKKLFNEIESDLKHTERFNNTVSAFSPVLWLESPDRKYANAIRGFMAIDAASTLNYMLSQLSSLVQHMTFLTSQDINPRPLDFKKILIICELIKIMPIRVDGENTSHHLRSLILHKYADKKIGLKNFQIIETIHSVVKFVSVGGSNIFLAKTNKIQMNILDNIPYLSCFVVNLDTFSTVMTLISHEFPKIQADFRTSVILNIYDWISQFFTQFPDVHKEILIKESKEPCEAAEQIMKCISDWKMLHDIEIVPFCCSMIPFCMTTLKKINPKDKKKPFHSVLRLLKSFNQKKENLRNAIISGIIELTDALVHTNFRKKEYDSLHIAVFKLKDKFDTWLYKPKHKHTIMQGSLITKLMPRYAALSFATSTELFKSKQVEFITQKPTSFLECQAMAGFFVHLLNNYPKRFDVSKIPQEKIINFRDYCTHALIEAQSCSEIKPELLKTCYLLIRFCNGKDKEKFSAMNLFSLQNKETLSLDVGKEMLLFFDGLTALPMSQIIGGVMHLIIMNVVKTIDKFIIFLRTALSCDSSTAEKITKVGMDVGMNFVTTLAIEMFNQVEKAILVCSPLLSVLPALYFRFMKWAEKILILAAETNKHTKFRLSDDFILCCTKSIIILKATTGDLILDKCDNILENILSYFDSDSGYKYKFPFSESITDQDEFVIYIVKLIFQCWLSYVQTMLIQDEIPKAVMSIAKSQVKFKVTRDQSAIVARFLAKTVHLLEKTMHPSNPSMNLHYFFFDTLLLMYHSSLQEDEKLTDLFKYLHNDSLGIIFKISASNSQSKFETMNLNSKFYLMSIADSLNNIITNYELNDIFAKRTESLFHVFTTYLQIGAFEDYKTINSMVRLYSNFYSKKFNTNKQIQKAIITVLASIGFKYSKNIDQNRDKLIKVSKSLAIILKNMDLSSTSGLEHIAELSSQKYQEKEIKYILNTLLAYVVSIPEPDMIITVQDILNSMLMNNTALAWPLYCKFVIESIPMFSMMLIESLSRIFGTVYKGITKPDLSVYQSKEISTNETDEVSTESMSISASSTSKPKKGIFKAFNNAIFSRRKIENSESTSTSRITSPPPISSQNLRPDISIKDAMLLQSCAHYYCLPISESSRYIPVENVYDIINENNFEMFRNPKIINIEFIRAGIGCVIQFNMHDKLFDTMMTDLNHEQPSFNTKNTFSVFFQGWFLQLSYQWNLKKVVEAISPTEFIDIIVADMPNHFVYYLQQFYIKTKNNNNLLSSLFLYCFLHPLFAYPIRYGVKTCPKDPGFFDKLTSMKEYQKLLVYITTAESFYPILMTNDFKHDQNIVFHFASHKPSVYDFFDLDFDSVARLLPEQPSPNDLYILEKAQFITNVGHTKDNVPVFMVSPNKIPTTIPHASIIWYFCHHFKNDDSKFEIVIVASQFTKVITEIFLKFYQNIPEWFMKKCKRAIFLNPTFTVEQEFARVGICVKPSTIEVRFTNDVEEVFTHDDKVFFPMRCYQGSTKGLGRVSVVYNNSICTLYFSHLYFLLCKESEILGQKIITQHAIMFHSISRISKTSESVSIYQNMNSICFQLITKAGTFIEGVYNLLSLHNKKTKINMISDLTDTTDDGRSDESVVISKKLNFLSMQSSNYRVHLIALALHLLAMGTSYNRTTTLMLLESALRGCTNSTNCDSPVSSDVQIDFLPFFKIIADNNLLEPVIDSLHNYLPMEPLDACQRLLPLYLMFFNATKDKCLIAKVAKNLLVFCKEPSVAVKFSSVLGLNITSPFAIEIIIPMIVWTRKDNDIATSRSITAIIPKHQKLFGKIIVNRLLDGLIRRHVFAGVIKPFIVFDSITALPFGSPDFVEYDFPSLLSNCIFGVFNGDADTIENISKFMTNSLKTIEITKQIDLSAEWIQISNILSDINSVSITKLIKTCSKALNKINPKYETDFIRLMTQTFDSDSPRVWCVKTAASVMKTGGNLEIAKQFVINLPKYTDSPMKLRLFYKTIDKILEKSSSFATAFPQIHSLFWLPLLTCASSSIFIRRSSLQLLERLLVFSLNAKMSIEVLIQTRHGNSSIDNSIAAFEKQMDVDFTNSFFISLIFVVTKSLEIEETRSAALSFFKNFVLHYVDSTKEAIAPEKMADLMLPFIAFYWKKDLLRAKGFQKVFGGLALDTVQQALFYKFEEKSEGDRQKVIQYLSTMLGELHCASVENMNSVASCIIYGSQKFPADFVFAKNTMSKKTWEMLFEKSEMQTHHELKIITAVATAFADVADNGKPSVDNLTILDVKPENLKPITDELAIGIIELF